MDTFKLQAGAGAAVVTAIGLMFALAGCSKPQATDAGPLIVGTYTVKAQAVTLTTEIPGRTNAWRVADVRPQVSGIIQKRLFTEGSDVKQGQPLYQIDPRPFQAALDKAQATLASSKQLADRDAKLLPLDGVSRQANDDAQAAWKQAAADVETARLNLEYTRVLAPISGFIGRSSVTEGALVQDGQTTAMATVQQIDPIYVDVTQSSDAMMRLRSELEAGKLASAGNGNAQVHVVLDDGTVLKTVGTLAFSEVSVDQGTSSVTLRAVFPNNDHRLLPGMYVRAQLDEGVDPQAIVVPEQAVQQDTTGAAFVWVVGNDSKVRMQRIKTDRTLGNTWLVSDGLKPGDTVVAEGTQLVHQGSVVQTQLADTIHIDLGDSARADTDAPQGPASGATAAADVPEATHANGGDTAAHAHGAAASNVVKG